MSEEASLWIPDATLKVRRHLSGMLGCYLHNSNILHIFYGCGTWSLTV